MTRVLIVCTVLVLWCVPAVGTSGEAALTVTEWELVERLTRLEEGQNTLRAEIRGVEQTLRAEIQGVEQTLRAEIRATAEAIKQLRDDMNARFAGLINLMVGTVLAFAGIVAVSIGFAIWDRRTMIRPFETKVREMEEHIAQNRQRLHALLEALRTLSQSDERLAEVLRRFQLL